MPASQTAPDADFQSFCLQRATKEFAEDLDKVRSSGDFKGDALPMLIKSLQQSNALFSATEKKRVLNAVKENDQAKGAQ